MNYVLDNQKFSVNKTTFKVIIWPYYFCIRICCDNSIILTNFNKPGYYSNYHDNWIVLYDAIFSDLCPENTYDASFTKSNTPASCEPCPKDKLSLEGSTSVDECTGKLIYI